MEDESGCGPQLHPLSGGSRSQMVMASLLMLWRRRQAFSKRRTGTIHTSQGKLNSFELIYLREDGWTLAKQKF